MKIFENLKNKSIDELAEWLAENCDFDFAPWWKWWDENYCKKCEPVTMCKYEEEYGFDVEHEYGWCELHERCKFFPDMNEKPNTTQTIKLWLESKCE